MLGAPVSFTAFDRPMGNGVARLGPAVYLQVWYRATPVVLPPHSWASLEL
jgi:hypothetical protein